MKIPGIMSYMSGAFSFFPEKKDSPRLYMNTALAAAKQNIFLNEEIICYQIFGSIYFFNWKNQDSRSVIK